MDRVDIEKMVQWIPVIFVIITLLYPIKECTEIPDHS